MGPLSCRTIKSTGILEDERSAKRPQKPVRVVPDSLESVYVQNMPLDIEELMNSQ